MTPAPTLCFATVAVLVLLPPPTSSQSQPVVGRVAVADPGWELTDTVGVERHLGRDALRLGSGTAYLPARRFRDGTIDFDLAVSSLRTFIGVRFRAQSPEVWEEIYFRPHKSGLPDAVQYAPAFAGGRSNWQLYHGPGETATARLPQGEWLHVKVVVRGSRAAVFLGGDATPVLVVPRLAHAPRDGFIGFWALDASAERGKGFPSAISNIDVRPGVAEFAFPEPAPEPAAPGVVTRWQVSSAFTPPAGPVVDLPETILRGSWRRATADPSGLVPVDRFVELPAGSSVLAVLARVTVRAPEAVRVPFSLGYSDDASVFLNGRLLFSGVNGYSYNFPRRDGLITANQATVHLPLRSGDNELILAVTDAFGGWGLMGRIAVSAGVTIVE
jgi:hypothetical protein